MGSQYDAFDRKCDRLQSQIRDLDRAIKILNEHRMTARSADVAIILLEKEKRSLENKLDRLLRNA